MIETSSHVLKLRR